MIIIYLLIIYLIISMLSSNFQKLYDLIEYFLVRRNLKNLKSII